MKNSKVQQNGYPENYIKVLSLSKIFYKKLKIYHYAAKYGVLTCQKSGHGSLERLYLL